MADKIVTLKDENDNNLYPTTSYNAVKDSNGNVLPSDFTQIGSTEKIDVIYDMRSSDADINRGWTTGATTGKTFRLDFTKYTSIRLYAYLNSCDTQLVFKVAERKGTTLPMITFNVSSYNALHFLKITLLSNGQTLQIGGWATYSYNLSSSNTLTVTKSTSSNANYYVYRIEGIY